MRFFIIFLFLILIFSLNCTDGYEPISYSNTYVPSSAPEFSVAESVTKMGTINAVEGQENIVIIFPVTGVKLKDGKINVNQDVTVMNGTKIIDAKTDIYGSNGLTIDVLKMGGNPKLTFAGVDLAVEIIPPPDLTGGIMLINITVKDLNSPGAVAKITRGFRSDKVFNPFLKPCSRTATENLAVNETQSLPSPPAASSGSTQAKPCNDQVIKTYTSGNATAYLSGVEKTSVQKEVDSFLIGKWILSKPSFTWYSESESIKNPDLNLDNTAAKPVPPGTLTVFQNKEFIWQKDNETTQGTMEQVIPRSYSDPKLNYWKIYSGKDNFYIYIRDDKIFINELESHLYSLTGKISS